VARPLPQVASFCLALLTAFAGLATAGPRVERVQSLVVLRTADEPDAAPLPTARPIPPETWPQRDAGRLAELSRRAQAREAGGPVADAAELQRRLGRLVRGAGAAIGVHVADLDEGTWLFDHHGAARLNPASNHKIVTAIAAVELLGADYRFETRLVRDGDALVLIGDGDPSLQVQGLYALASEAIAAGAHVGARRIVVDERAFTGERHGPGYEEPPGPGPSYLAPSGALSLAFNTVEVTVRRDGPSVSVETSPASAHVAIVDRSRPGRGRALEATSACAGERTVVTITGAARQRATTIRRRICDPGRFTGEAFAAVLAELGGEALPVEVGAASGHALPVASLKSPPLVEILASALKYSNNFTSEQVLRTLGRRMTGGPGSWDNGRAALAAFWRAIGNDPAELVAENGSGLSLRGRVSPRGLVRVLTLTRDEGSPAAALMPALAGAGGEGTLRTRLPSGRGRVRGKTGTIGGVSALSGLAATPDGRRSLGFSILVNGKRLPTARARRLQDEIVAALLGHLDGA
jgi:D-alanyl-D-alanine carboxypeptidase/D-alanyl-D-alanine-endopeptidase (penicillin-binding protein 4)